MSSIDQGRALLLEGIRHFNEARFWDAHESWETLWLESTEPQKTFLQGLIQLTAACHHFQRGTLSGGVRLVDAAAEKLSDYPEDFMGLSRAGALEACLQARDQAAERLSGTSSEQPLRAEAFFGLKLQLHADLREE